MEDSGGSFAGPLRLVGFVYCSRVLTLALHLSHQAPNNSAA
ncbi:unnamed protein product [Musa acuminata subsp. malaccensis]|uniref:(wild Malaysian banana) hypothetical protein n=1 Tax=Musa acuminata subsp. malaccensis TaxID=214687 RepID=A0A804KAN5_MUSAM|nr:unnamed protein product [Musa acuminata subsp. malaccensis]